MPDKIRNGRFRHYVCDDCHLGSVCDQISLLTEQKEGRGDLFGSRRRLKKTLKGLGYHYPFGVRPCALTEWSAGDATAFLEAMLVRETGKESSWETGKYC